MTLLESPTTPAAPAEPRDAAGGKGMPRGHLVAWPFAMGLFSLFALGLFGQRLAAPDSYLDLYAGRYIAAHGIPHTEAITTAASGHAWVDQQWLAQILYYLTWRVGGYPAFILLSELLIAGAFALQMRTLLHRQVPARRALGWTTVALLACMTNTVPRAQSFAFPLFVGVLGALVIDAQAPRWNRRLLLIVPALALWANLHGSVLLGAGMVVLYGGVRAIIASRGRDRDSALGYGGLAALASLSPLATPYGWSMVGYYRSVLTNSTLTRTVSEWKPPAWSDHVSYGYFVVLALVTLTVLVTAVGRRRLPPLLPALVTVATLAMSLRAVRNDIWFLLAGTTLAAMMWHRTGPRRRSRLLVPFGVFSIILASFSVFVTATTSHVDSGVSKPVLAATDRALAEHPGAAVIGDEEPTSLLLWLHPDTAGRVAFDIRFEQYSPHQLSQFVGFVTGQPGSARFAARYGIALLSVKDRPAAVKMLRKDPQWVVLEEDSRTVAFRLRSAT